MTRSLRFALAFLVLSVAACLVAACFLPVATPRPPNTREMQYSEEINACVDVSDTPDAYVKCRSKVDARYGRDGGSWR